MFGSYFRGFFQLKWGMHQSGHRLKDGISRPIWDTITYGMPTRFFGPMSAFLANTAGYLILDGKMPN